VQIALPLLNIKEASILSMYSSSPIISPQHANVVVNQIKKEISKELTRTKSEKIHLFFAGPAHLALFLGHRLNATAPVQCYEWTGRNDYVPTCLLFSKS
jgi:SMODS-associated and fused to various effectors sensor domain